MATHEEVSKHLESATKGFDHLFSNDLEKARETFDQLDSPFHLLGAGVCAFLEAALGMESTAVTSAAQSLAQSEAGARKMLKNAKSSGAVTRFPPGTEWELLHSDAVILNGITNALSESYMGYLQCLYALNNAHSKFTKLYKTVYPHGLDHFSTPSTSVTTSRTPSVHSNASSVNLTNNKSASVPPTPTTPSAPASIKSAKSGFFSRFGSTLGVPNVISGGKEKELLITSPEGPVEELIMSGTAFGYGMFNLVFSLLPAAIRNVVGFLGFKHDRKVALRALAVSAAQNDVHSVFAGLTLMTYYGVVLLLSGYQADEAHILRQYKAIVENIDTKYPTGSLWILNRAKILRMSYDTPGAIEVLQTGLRPDRPHTFVQADGLLIFELAWTLLSQRRYQEAAETFMKMTEVNSWSHGTYHFVAAGCYVSLKNYSKAQELLDAIPDLIDKKKIGGKDLPTEVFIKKKLQFYRDKQRRLTGSEEKYAECIKISPAEELAIFWNTHSRVSKEIAHEHITELTSYTPPVSTQSPLIPPFNTATTPIATSPSSTFDLDTPDEIAIRALLLGIVHRTAGEFMASREFLEEAHKMSTSGKVKTSTWIGGVAMFELAVLDLKEAESVIGSQQSQSNSPNASAVSSVASLSINTGMDEGKKEKWRHVLKSANEKLDVALSLAGRDVDLSSRLDTRIAMLRDEIGMKKEMIDGGL